MAGRQVLVTGASGFIGSHVTQRLLQSGYRVRASVRNLKDFKRVVPLQELCPYARYPLELIQADLLDSDCWHKAVEGCDYVMHVASPVPLKQPLDEDSVIKPALEGTLNVLQAAKESKAVQRVVFTSCLAAITGDTIENRTTPYTEDDWADISDPDLSAYTKGKCLAEMAAWDFVDKNQDCFELSVVNPCTAYGPVLCGTFSGSMLNLRGLLRSKRPRITTNFPVNIVDVRDVATAHLAAMETLEAEGNRHILIGKASTIKEFAEILSEEFLPQAYQIPIVEEWLITKLLPRKKQITLDCSMIDRHRMTGTLGINEPYSMKDTLVDMAYSMIESEFIDKTSKYQKRNSNQ